MNKKVLKTLEFDKILEKTAGFATAESVKQQILNLTPSDDLYEVNERLNETDEALKSLLKYATPPACPVKEQEASIKRALNGGVLSMSELLSISKMIKCGRMYHDYGEGLAEFPCLSGYIRDIFVYNTLENDINSAILNEDEMADNASADLLSIRRTMKQLNNKIRDTLNGLISSGNYSKYLQEAIITTRSGRYVVPVKAEHKGSVPGLVHDTSSTGATIFVEPMAVVEANNKLKQEETKEKYEIERILQQFSAKIAECGEDLLVNIKMLEHLDFAFAKAKLSLDMFGVMPKINNDGIINIKKARHPLIPKEKVVPIDIELGKNFDTLVITGPNTGGKTVSLKTFGLLCLMMQSGLHIPASDNPEMCMFKEIFADIGDEQSIEQSLSTFSSHMVTIVDIVEKSGENSLVLFDELGAGTDPTEGAALAMAVLEYVREKGAKTVATTHYSELKLYAMTTDRVENASCEFNVETLRPTYRLNIGIPGKSNAFAISKKLGLKEDILERAENYLSSENIRFEDVLSSLE
ncbi:MAG: endonuclease MutS2 [Clostridia bacterium]|nr:endonuclease MutS2 [Clostridia bacterium]